jgi:2-amino-4-hydroxy-6-hydroxymethyldihydropteridine diphosphokinase
MICVLLNLFFLGLFTSFMIKSVNFRVLNISEWSLWYRKIVRDFGYSRAEDRKAAIYLDSILRPYPKDGLKKLIRGKTVFVVGAGPSVASSVSHLKKFRQATVICADSAITILAKNKIMPHIIVTDLDGDLKILRKLGRTKTVFVVHAHGDNIGRLDMVRNFANCIGTTQTRSIGRVHNFGGFTDGDRCVFLAEHFGASRIILLGMDFGKRIGRQSGTKKSERQTKLKKLKYAKMLLERLSQQSGAEMYTLSRPIKGFKKINQVQLKQELESEFGSV